MNSYMGNLIFSVPTEGLGPAPHPLPTKAYTTLVPKFEKQPLFAGGGVAL